MAVMIILFRRRVCDKVRKLLILDCLIPFLSPLGMLGEAGKSAEMCGDERIRC